MKFGEFILSSRMNRRLTRKQLAEESQVTTTTIRNCEYGFNSPSVETCERLCRALGVKYIIGKKDGDEHVSRVV